MKYVLGHVFSSAGGPATRLDRLMFNIHFGANTANCKLISKVMWPFIKNTLEFVFLAIAVVGIAIFMSVISKKSTNFSSFHEIDEALNCTLARSGEIKYQASIQFGGAPVCSGTLIYKQYVLTLASCVSEAIKGDAYKTKIKVFIDTRTIPGGTPYDVEKITRHASYDPKTFTDDIALVKLTKEVAINPFVKPISLPQKEQSPYEGLKLVASGYDRTGHETIVGRSDQHIFSMRVVSSETCRKLFKGWDLSGKFCAVADPGYDPYLSDPGSPATVKKKYLVGLWRTAPCQPCRKKYAELFVNVWSYIDFIQSAVDPIYPSRIETSPVVSEGP